MSSKHRLKLMAIFSIAKDKLMRLMGRTSIQILERRRDSLSKELFRLQDLADARTRTCKIEDDAFFDRLVKTGEALHIARRNIDDDLLHAINTFPVNTPCTTKVIANQIGMHVETVERMLIEKSCADDRDDSDPSKRVFEWSNYERYSYSHTYYIVKTICQPNWRFVDNGKYIERYEQEE